MSRFWIGAAGILLIGLAAVFSAGGGQTALSINDLETECRYDRTTYTEISLNPDNSLSFQGHFPVENVNSDMNVDYSGGNSIVLNVKSQRLAAPVKFWNDCLASAVYDLDTPQLEPGTYSVEVKHEGERVEKRIIRIKE